MILATIESIENVEVEKTLGVVSAVGSYSAGSQITGGMTTSSDEMYDKCFDEVSEKLIAKADKLGADAIVGINVDYVSKDSTHDMVIQINGTAVKLKASKELSKLKKSYYKAQEESAAATTNEADYEMAMMTGAVAPKSEFELSCEKIAEHFELDEKYLDVLKAFKQFAWPMQTLDIKNGLTTEIDRLELNKMCQHLVDLGVLKDDRPYYLLMDLGTLHIGEYARGVIV